ncbi:hypothetical protein GCM10023175_59860 [Pseudonocardia xishanensis]|uniref:Uncharacterized protein n=1 Tax=Pseudonocardia xishanensis TaxID=630995 RepID=A0ABP8S0D9_9PSEU
MPYPRTTTTEGQSLEKPSEKRSATVPVTSARIAPASQNHMDSTLPERSLQNPDGPVNRADRGCAERTPTSPPLDPHRSTVPPASIAPGATDEAKVLLTAAPAAIAGPVTGSLTFSD